MGFKKFKHLVMSFIFVGLLSCQSHDVPEGFQDIKTITLDNGMTFILAPRKGAPVVSTNIRVKVGSADEVQGQHGLAHFFEHMAFKGTQTIGTKDFAKEKVLLDKIIDVGTQIVQRRSLNPNDSALPKLKEELHQLQKQANAVTDVTELMKIYKRNGGSDINAYTSFDFTVYHVSLPTNRLELWAYLESERLKAPVMREFFSEIDVIVEERRMRIDNSPFGKIYSTLLNLMFDNSPYGTVVIGPERDILSYTPQAALAFYKKHYIPQNMVGSIVGDFDVAEAEKIIRKYFGTLPRGQEIKTDAPYGVTEHAGQPFPRYKEIEGDGKERFMLSYLTPNFLHEDYTTLKMIAHILCSGSSSRLYKELAIEQKILSPSVGCEAGFPGERLETSFMFYGEPQIGKTSKEGLDAIQNQITRLAEEGPDEKELDKIKNFLERMNTYEIEMNDDFADSLTYNQLLKGDWKDIFSENKKITSVSSSDIKRVMKKYFVPEKQATVVMKGQAQQ